MFTAPERYRVTSGACASSAADGNDGVFRIPLGHSLSSGFLLAFATESTAWEHVSVSMSHRAPTWAEMCAVKSLFWGDHDVVVQFHPSAANVQNSHPYVLHLWRPIGPGIPTPPFDIRPLVKA